MKRIWSKIAYCLFVFFLMVVSLKGFVFSKNRSRPFTVAQVGEFNLVLERQLGQYNKCAEFLDSLIVKRDEFTASLGKYKMDTLILNKKIGQLLLDKNCEVRDSCLKLIESLLGNYRKVLLNDLKSIDLLNKDLQKGHVLYLQRQKERDLLLPQIRATADKVNGSCRVNFKGTTYLFFVVNPDSLEINLHHKDSLTKKPYFSIDNLYRHLVKKNLKPLMITNAGMYTVNHEPQGLFIENYHELYPVDTTRPNDNNFYLKPNGVFFLDQHNNAFVNTTEAFLRKYKSKAVVVKYATQSGPMLLIDGKIHPVFTANSENRKIRNGVGVNGSKKVVFAISVDEVNFYDFASFFKDVFNCKDALFLDGSISRMYLFDKAPNEKGGNFGPIISVVKPVR